MTAGNKVNRFASAYAMVPTRSWAFPLLGGPNHDTDCSLVCRRANRKSYGTKRTALSVFNGRHRGGCTTRVCTRTAAHGAAHPQGPFQAREQQHPQRQPSWNRDSKPWLTTSAHLSAPTESGRAISPPATRWAVPAGWACDALVRSPHPPGQGRQPAVADPEVRPHQRGGAWADPHAAT